MNAICRREISVVVNGTVHVGQYEVTPFYQGGHAVVVYYQGMRIQEYIATEANEVSYTDSFAQKLLAGLIDSGAINR